MQKEISLKVDALVLSGAERYARRKGKTLSDLLSQVLKNFAAEEPIPQCPKTASLLGIAKLPSDFDSQKELDDYYKNQYG